MTLLSSLLLFHTAQNFSLRSERRSQLGLQFTTAKGKKPKTWKFKYRITIPKKFRSVVLVKVSNRKLTESESEQVAASFR